MAEAQQQTRLITTKRAAELLGVTPNWLYIMRKRGDGPEWTRIGARQVRYFEDSVLSYRARGGRRRGGRRALANPIKCPFRYPGDSLVTFMQAFEVDGHDEY